MPEEKAQRLSLDARHHKEGCPAARLESTRARRAAQNGGEPREVEVVRCIDCGGQAERPAGR